MDMDIEVKPHGSITLLFPWSLIAEDWLHTHTPADAQWWASALVVEPRYVDAIVAGAREDGLEVC
jgi:hypothetical protein